MHITTPVCPRVNGFATGYGATVTTLEHLTIAAENLQRPKPPARLFSSGAQRPGRRRRAITAAEKTRKKHT